MRIKRPVVAVVIVAPDLADELLAADDEDAHADKIIVLDDGKAAGIG